MEARGFSYPTLRRKEVGLAWVFVPAASYVLVRALHSMVRNVRGLHSINQRLHIALLMVHNSHV